MGFAVLAGFMVGLFIGATGAATTLRKEVKAGHTVIDGVLYVCVRA